ncbi:hypothetical protein D3C76_1624830 [compost metagenome]
MLDNMLDPYDIDCCLPREKSFRFGVDRGRDAFSILQSGAPAKAAGNPLDDLPKP